MKTATIKVTRQELETVLFALTLFGNDASERKKEMLQWYRDNEEFELLDSEALQELIERVSTSSAAPQCIVCGWDATSALGTTENRYCDECKPI